MEIRNIIETRCKEIETKKITNITTGVCSLFAKNRGQSEFIEMLSDSSIKLPKYKFKTGYVPNPWVEWKINEPQSEFPPDFVYPPITRRHYKF